MQTDDSLTATNLYSRQQDQPKTRQELYFPLSTKRNPENKNLNTHMANQDTAGEGGGEHKDTGEQNQVITQEGKHRQETNTHMTDRGSLNEKQEADSPRQFQNKQILT